HPFRLDRRRRAGARRAARRSVPGARSVGRGALSLARRAQLRAAQPAGDGGAYLPRPAPRRQRTRVRILHRRRRKVEGAEALAPNPQWYKEAIIYEIHVRAFADSNDDGIGDFNGLVAQLDYLKDLGVTRLWL